MKNLTSGHMSRRRVFASGSLVLAGPLLSTAYAQAVNESPKPAPGKNPPADIQALIESHVKAFNTHNTQLFMSVFSDTAVIIDGIPSLPEHVDIEIRPDCVEERNPAISRSGGGPAPFWFCSGDLTL
jgi:hypothetical protein